jgi:uncharacterized phage protein (TIGR02220 family)
MAEGKRSIVVYADWIDKFEELEDDEAGRLIKHFFRYVNDLNPEAPDRITKLSFIDIEKQLKRDLKKWEKTVDDRSYNGRLGNIKRWHIDLYNEIILENITLEEAEYISKHRKTSLPDEKVSPPIANIAVNDTVTVTVNNNINTNLSVDFEKLKVEFNNLTGKKTKVVSEKAKRQIKARLKEGYTKQDLWNAIVNCFNDPYHKENPKYLTLEFISRSDKMEKYCENLKTKKPKEDKL